MCSETGLSFLIQISYAFIISPMIAKCPGHHSSYRHFFLFSQRRVWKVGSSEFYVTLCNSGNTRRFVGTYHLHPQGNRQKQATRWAQIAAHFCWLPWRWRRYVPPKRRASSKLHGVRTQKTVTLHRCSWLHHINIWWSVEFLDV
jgi:hypothetical protein